MKLSEDTTKIDKLVNFIFLGIVRKRWLYWPPGPMTSQIFDKDQCKQDLQRWLESEGE